MCVSFCFYLWSRACFVNVFLNPNWVKGCIPNLEHSGLYYRWVGGLVNNKRICPFPYLPTVHPCLKHDWLSSPSKARTKSSLYVFVSLNQMWVDCWSKIASFPGSAKESIKNFQSQFLFAPSQSLPCICGWDLGADTALLGSVFHTGTKPTQNPTTVLGFVRNTVPWAPESLARYFLWTANPSSSPTTSTFILYIPFWMFRLVSH